MPLEGLEAPSLAGSDLEVLVLSALGACFDEHPWPLTRDRWNNEVDLSLILPETTGLVDKLYSPYLRADWTAFA